MWEYFGEIANVAQLIGIDAMKLIGMIEPLEELEDALRSFYILVNSCQDESYLYLLAIAYSEEELLEFLQQHAIMVWGLWTAKSSLLYPHDGVETLSRDYALLLLSKSLQVHSSDVNVRELASAESHLKLFSKITSVAAESQWGFPLETKLFMTIGYLD
ncbi:hypothetical protein JHK86_002098 [Glycine max]|nr:hypothetical protein JHK86_002098 [Glycine max]